MNRYILSRYDNSTAIFTLDEIRAERIARANNHSIAPVQTKFNSISLNELMRATQHSLTLRLRQGHSILSSVRPSTVGKDKYMSGKDWESNLVV